MESIDIRTWPWEGKDVIRDEMVKDPDTDLYRGKCLSCDETDQFVANIMIRKGAKIKKVTYDMLKGFQHETCIPHLNFYTEGEANNMGRLVIPEVQYFFVNWIRDCGKEYLFDARRKMSPLFRTMIVDLCDLVQKLYDDKQILIKNLELKNLYLAAEITPRILLLVTEAELNSKEISMNALWKPLCDLIESIYKACGFDLNQDLEARRYLSFLGTPNFTVRALERYPFNWDDQTKKEYLIALIAAEQNGKDGIRSLSSAAHIEWPSVHGKLPNVLDEIIKHHGQIRRIVYNTKVPFDYVRLIRNTYKHYDTLPYSIQGVFGTKNGFLKKIEEWSPDIWKDLYDMIGWP